MSKVRVAATVLAAALVAAVGCPYDTTKQPDFFTSSGAWVPWTHEAGFYMLRYYAPIFSS
jgi:hypothetical protein